MTGAPDAVSGAAPPAIEFRNVARLFRGRNGPTGLDGLTLDVPSGVTAALMGPNGSGKTTALRIAATLVAPDRGTVKVGGFDCVREARRARRLVGVSLGGTRSFYWRITAAHNLSFFAALKGVPPVRAGRIVHALALELGFAGALGVPARGLSRGMLGRMAVARALIADPYVLLLDEPFVAIDREGRDFVWEALTRRARAGCAVLLTTHDEGLAGRCDRVATLSS